MHTLQRFRPQLIWVAGSVGFAGIWLAYVYFFEPDEIGLFATAFATACLMALIQVHYKK